MTEQIPLILLFVFILSFYLAVKSLRSNSDKQETTNETTFQNLIFLIRLPKGNEKQALAAEQMFASLHGLLRETPDIQEHVSFEIVSSEQGISFYVVIPPTVKEFVIGQIYAQYPDAEISNVSQDYTQTLSPELPVAVGVIGLTRESYYPIKTFRDFEVDPLAGITGSLGEMHHGGRVWWQMLVRPEPDVWQEEGHDFVARERGDKKAPPPILMVAIKQGIADFGKALIRGLLFIAPPKEEEKKEEKKEITISKTQTLTQIETKLTKLGFKVCMRVLASHPDAALAEDYIRRVGAAYRQYSQVNLNSFKISVDKNTAEGIKHFKSRSFVESETIILTTDELASVFHFPSKSVETPAINWSPSKRAEPPLNLPVTDCTYFGLTSFRDKLVKFGIKEDDRRRHVYCIGKTGTGKSTVFKNMIVQDMNSGKGVGVIDPHGQLIDELLNLVPDNRLEDVVIFDPSDSEYPVAINMLEANTKDVAQRNLLASGLLEAFRKNFEYSWGPRLEYLLNNAILTLVSVEKTTMLGLVRLLMDKNYRRYIVHQIDDPVLKSFWEVEYKEFESQQRLATEAISPIQNKVGRFLASSTIRNILGQARSSIRFDEIMNNKKILFINLSKGRIGADNSNLLGSLIVSRINFMAMQRVDIPEEQRADFNLYVDEFQNFATGEFTSILSEARKYRLNLHLTHQYTKQLPEEILDAIIGNVGTIIALTLGAPDARDLEPEFFPTFTANDLINLEKYHFYVKMMIESGSSLPFSGITLPPPTSFTDNRAKAVDLSRSKYGRSRDDVERFIQRWVSRQFDLGMAKSEEREKFEN